MGKANLNSEKARRRLYKCVWYTWWGRANLNFHRFIIKKLNDHFETYVDIPRIKVGAHAYENQKKEKTRETESIYLILTLISKTDGFST